MDQTERVVAAVRDALGSNVIGIYLYGSAVLGGLHPTSDLDILVVTRQPMKTDEKHGLISRLLPISGRGDPTGASRSIGLEIVVQSDVRPWRYPPRLELQYGDWWRAEFERGELPWESPSPDLALLLAMVLQADHALFGPPPGEVLDPVPPADVRSALFDVVPSLLDDLIGDERNVVLTFARIWATLDTGCIYSKDGAAEWALTRLPLDHRAVLEHAKAIYLGEVAEEWGDLLPRVRPHVDYVLGQIEGLREGRQP